MSGYLPAGVTQNALDRLIDDEEQDMKWDSITSPSATANTSVAALPISLPSWSRKPDGRHLARATTNRPAAQFALVIQDLAAAYPFARHIHLVVQSLTFIAASPLPTDHLGAKQGRYLWSRLARQLS